MDKVEDEPSVTAMHANPATHTGHAVWQTRETYCKPGLRGILASRYVALCAAFSALGGVLFGFDQGVVTVILVEPQFLSRFARVAEGVSGAGFWKGLLTAMIELGALLGALNQGWIADKISRKYSIVVAVCVFTVGSALQAASMDYAMLVTARFIGGLGIGMLSMVVPLYISEISPPEIRGTLLVLEEFSIVTGIVVAFYITYGTQYIPSEWAWRLPFVLQIIPGLILGVGILFLPFSPRWLASKSRDHEALQSLVKLRSLPDTDPRVQLEWFDIRAEAALHKELASEKHPHLQDGTNGSRFKLEIATWADLFKNGCWRRTHVGVGIMFFQQFVGINALIYYSPTLFQTMGLDHGMQLIMSGVLNICQLVGVSTSIWSMDVFGRRPLLLFGSGMMFFSHAIIAVLVGKFSYDWPSHRLEGWASVSMLLLYMISFGASWGPVPWALPSEIFPSSLRAKGVALSTCANWSTNFIIGLITPPLVERTGYGAYVLFAVFCLLSLLWTYFFVPETKGRTLEQMDHVFNDVGSEAEEERRERIERAIASKDHANRNAARYIKPDEATSKAISQQFSAKAALTAIESKAPSDPVNPPRSVLPPPLDLPERGDAQTVFIYYFRIGRAYGTFYKEGIKAVWYNYKASRLLRERITKELGAKDRIEAAAKGLITRAEYQLLQRNDHDIGKLPFFGVLVLVFGEWLPLLVPFMPGAVPGTCRIPKQVRGMREKAEERRRISFRQGITEPSKEQLPDDRMVVAGRPGAHAEWPMADKTYVRKTLETLRDDQLHHLSSTLGLHSRLWDRLQLGPPVFLLRRALTKRLHAVTLDDKLLLRHGSSSKLSMAEFEIAAEDRGLDILGKKNDVLRDNIGWWLKRQEEDKGRGGAMLAMLFRRLAIREWVQLNLQANYRSQA
ncbi:hypothetical protein LTR85_010567 [Meristemomyces frigidus]|nr:hypothetical protein LTR85_010567 [Meristemomyces frigidus]